MQTSVFRIFLCSRTEALFRESLLYYNASLASVTFGETTLSHSCHIPVTYIGTYAHTIRVLLLDNAPNIPQSISSQSL